MTIVCRPSRETARAPGRPSIYTEALADEICERLACGESLRRICSEPGMPDKATVIRWLAKNASFRTSYTHARAVQADVWADEIHDLAKSEPQRNRLTGCYDLASVRHIRNQVATLQWLAHKLTRRSTAIGKTSSAGSAVRAKTVTHLVQDG